MTRKQIPGGSSPRLIVKTPPVNVLLKGGSKTARRASKFTSRPPTQRSVFVDLDSIQQEVVVRPRLFVGSSVENLPWARLFQRELQHNVDVTLWSQGIFRPTDYPLESLLRKLDDADFGMFLCVPEDFTRKRKKSGPSVRDNVLVELGLYLGRLGRTRAFIAIPDNAPKDFLPTDFLGLTPVTFQVSNGHRQDSIGSASSQVLERIADIGPKINESRMIPTKALEQFGVCLSELKGLLDNENFLRDAITRRMSTTIGIAHDHSQSIADHVWPGSGVVVSLKLPDPNDPTLLKCYYLNARMPPRRLAMSPPMPEPGTIPIKGSIAGLAFKSWQTVFVESLANPPKDLDVDRKLLAKLAGIVGSVIASPLRLHGDPVGVVKLDAEREGFFQAGDPVAIAVVRSIVACLEMAFKIATLGSLDFGSSVVLPDQTQKEASDRRRTKKRVRRSN